LSIFKKLKFDDVSLGSVQSVDEMTVVPVIGGRRGDLAEASEIVFQRTTNYGTMVFRNENPKKEGFVPTNIMVRGTGAQDHAMSTAGVIGKGTSKSFENACCIEESQGGLLGSENNVQDVLPVNLRREFVDSRLRSEHDYSKLWGKIRNWLRGLKLGGTSAHLRFFYDNQTFKTSLEEFAAEFEPVEGQIGAIILFSGIPVGIEIMPSPEHWDHYWKLLIRGCYGAELLRRKQLGEITSSALVLPDIPEGASAEEVKTLLNDLSQHLVQQIIPMVENIKVSEQTRSIDNDGSLRTTVVTTTDGGIGNVIRQSNEPVYLSIVL